MGYDITSLRVAEVQFSGFRIGMILYVHPGTCAGGGVDISGSELEMRMAEFDHV